MADTQLNADMTLPVSVRTATMDWQPSPSPTVWRKRLHLSGPPEAGVVTSVVRYDAGSQFHGHPHPDGEEILVLDGVFSDEHGDWPAGTYLLNPEGFHHAPFSREGCRLFVKLRQYAGDRRHLCVQTRDLPWVATDTPQRSVRTLYQVPDFPDSMAIERWSAGMRMARCGPVEMFVLGGEARCDGEPVLAGDWLRWPAAQSRSLVCDTGCEVFVKSGHF